MERKIEQRLIWALIMDPEQIQEVTEIISSKDFFDPLYKHAYETICKLNIEKRIFDLPSLYLEMGRPKQISQIFENVDSDTLSSPAHYAELLKQRNLENEINDSVKKMEFDKTIKAIEELGLIGKTTPLKRICELVETTDFLEKRFKTGFTDLDSIVSFCESDLMIISGRTSIGKSSLGLSMLYNMALDGISVGMISFEMSEKGIAKRLFQNHSIAKLNQINERFFLHCPSVFNLREVRKTVRDMKLKNNVAVILIDYLQLMSETKEFRSRHLEISYIIRQLKEIAKEFRVGMIVISQLSRGIDTRGEHARPLLGDLKESGDVEHAAEIVLFVHKEKNENNAEFIVAKNRYGAKGIIQLVWIPGKVCYGSREWKEQKY